MDDEKLQAQLLAEYDGYESESSGHDQNYDNENNQIGSFILLNFIWIQGLRTNSNLIYVPDEQQIYCGNGVNRKYDEFRFRCYSDSCQAKIFLRNDGTVVQEPGTKHSHGSMYVKYKEMLCFNAMKSSCLSATASTTPREIYDQSVIE